MAIKKNIETFIKVKNNGSYKDMSDVGELTNNSSVYREDFTNIFFNNSSLYNFTGGYLMATYNSKYSHYTQELFFPIGYYHLAKQGYAPSMQTILYTTSTQGTYTISIVNNKLQVARSGGGTTIVDTHAKSVIIVAWGGGGGGGHGGSIDGSGAGGGGGGTIGFGTDLSRATIKIEVNGGRSFNQGQGSSTNIYSNNRQIYGISCGHAASESNHTMTGGDGGYGYYYANNQEASYYIQELFHFYGGKGGNGSGGSKQSSQSGGIAGAFERWSGSTMILGNGLISAWNAPTKTVYTVKGGKGGKCPNNNTYGTGGGGGACWNAPGANGPNYNATGLTATAGGGGSGGAVAVIFNTTTGGAPTNGGFTIFY